mgnify:CR=1 FL=1
MAQFNVRLALFLSLVMAALAFTVYGYINAYGDGGSDDQSADFICYVLDPSCSPEYYDYAIHEELEALELLNISYDRRIAELQNMIQSECDDPVGHRTISGCFSMQIEIERTEMLSWLVDEMIISWEHDR